MPTRIFFGVQMLFVMTSIVYAMPIAERLMPYDGTALSAETAHASHTCASGLIPRHSGRGQNASLCDTPAVSSQLKAADPAQNPSSELSTWEWFTTGAFLISITGILLSLAGWLLNGAVQFFILDMGKYLGSDSAIGKSIITSWALIRDIINLTFVFGLIYLAFMTIARADTQKLKHGVAQIIVAALLINFSLFFAKAIIDIANVTTVEIYSAMQQESVQNPDAWLNDGISGFFMTRLGLSKFIDAKAVVTAGGTETPGFAVDKHTSFGFSLMVSLVLIITSFVFFAGAILIAIRFVVLALLLVLSPVAFAGAFLPKLNTEEWSRMWWSKLVSQALFAPAYFLLLFISMKATDTASFAASSQGGGMVDFFAGNTTESTMGAMLNFIMIIGFLVGSLIIAKRMGAVGADFSTRLGARASFGLTAALGRNTVGLLGHRMANSEGLKDRASRKGVAGFIARRTLNTSRMAQKASFDARGLSGVQAIAKNHHVDLNIGDAAKGGFAGGILANRAANVEKKEKEYAASLGTIDDKDPRVMALKHEAEEAEKVMASLKNKKQTAKGTAKDDVDIEIRAQEKKVKAAHEAVEQEKNRRQVGAAVTKTQVEELALTNTSFGNARAVLESRKGDLKKAIHSASAATSTQDRETHLAEIKKLQKEIGERETEIDKTISEEFRGKDVGYAGLLASYGHVFSALQGRTRSMNKDAAKGIRDLKKAHKKEEKKEKAHAATPPAAGGGAGSHGHP